MEYLVTMTTHVPDGTPEQAVDDVRAREAAHSRDLAAEGQLVRLWRPPQQPGEWRSLGLFAAADAGQLQQTLASMPLWALPGQGRALGLYRARDSAEMEAIAKALPLGRG
jgi:muconolactone D-isomerase